MFLILCFVLLLYIFLWGAEAPRDQEPPRGPRVAHQVHHGGDGRSYLAYSSVLCVFFVSVYYVCVCCCFFVIFIDCLCCCFCCLFCFWFFMMNYLYIYICLFIFAYAVLFYSMFFIANLICCYFVLVTLFCAYLFTIDLVEFFCFVSVLSVIIQCYYFTSYLFYSTLTDRQTSTKQ